MSDYLFTSESVGIGHPDKISDQISDAILDACLAQDPEARVACEVATCSGFVLITGEITSVAQVDYSEVARQTIRKIGYDQGSTGFDYRSCGILLSLNKQSPDIAQGVTPSQNPYGELGAGDQGIMFGYASDETPELMPLPIMLAHKLMWELYLHRHSRMIPYLRPDAKSQVTVQYDKDHTPRHIHTVVLSTQHDESVKQETLLKEMKELIQGVFPKNLLSDKTLYYINPTGRFVIGGPVGDSGFTGRKIIVDTYGGMARQGGGAFSGKDPTKVDRSGAYAARYVAKNIVAAKLARRCEVQISYAIGIPYPLSIRVETFGTAAVDEENLCEAVKKVFDLTPRGMIEMLDLKRPIYGKTAFGGHFGRIDPDFTWEKVDRVDALKHALEKQI